MNFRLIILLTICFSSVAVAQPPTPQPPPVEVETSASDDPTPQAEKPASDDPSETAVSDASKSGPSEEELATARKLFADGVAAANQNNYPLAIRRFRAAQNIKDAPAIRLNLATALSRRGENLEAAQLAESVIHDAESSADLVEKATALRTQLAPRVAAVNVTVMGASGPADTTLDARAIPIGRDIAVAPGTHMVQVVRDNVILARQSVNTPVGQVQQVSLNVLSVESAAQSTETPPPEEPTENKTPLHKDWRFWTVVGAAVVVIAVVAIIIVASSGTESPIEGNFTPGVLQW